MSAKCIPHAFDKGSYSYIKCKLKLHEDEFDLFQLILSNANYEESLFQLTETAICLFKEPII